MNSTLVVSSNKVLEVLAEVVKSVVVESMWVVGLLVWVVGKDASLCAVVIDSAVVSSLPEVLAEVINSVVVGFVGVVSSTKLPVVLLGEVASLNSAVVTVL